MRYHIDTIPVWDAIKLQGECPLCAIRRKNEHIEVHRYLGASVMEPDTRVQVNERGFCARHQAMLFSQSNRLGHGLMLHTHLKETQRRLTKTLAQLQQAGEQLSGIGGIARLMKKGSSASQAVIDCAKALETATESCILCDTLKENMYRYVKTFLHLWRTDATFKNALKDSKGLCLPDTALLLKAGAEHLPPDALGDLAQALAALTETNLARLEKELEWFTLKFDYRNREKPWENSKDAVERTCNKLRGWCAGEEPFSKEP
ncbi:MAG: hypothetical protein IJ461_07485 [Clostridia bacterium]|nr:hypothetical protein [Clostridia bacterium]